MDRRRIEPKVPKNRALAIIGRKITGRPALPRLGRRGPIFGATRTDGGNKILAAKKGRPSLVDGRPQVLEGTQPESGLGRDPKIA